MNLEELAALEQKLKEFFGVDPDEVKTDPVEEEPLVIHGQGEYAKKIYPSDLK